MEQATDTRVRESVPDTFLQQADQVVNLDLAVEDLLERMRAGKIYADEKVARSLASFFQEEKLSALRELALREVAESLGRAAAGQAAAGELARAHGEPARHGLHLVALAAHRGAAAPRARASPGGSARTGTWSGWRRPARRPTGSTRPRSACSTTNTEMARALGAEIVRLHGRDRVTALLDFARSHAVGHIVIGRSQSPLWRTLAGRDFVQRMVYEADDFDLHVVGSRDVEGGAVSLRSATPAGLRSARARARAARRVRGGRGARPRADVPEHPVGQLPQRAGGAAHEGGPRAARQTRRSSPPSGRRGRARAELERHVRELRAGARRRGGEHHRAGRGGAGARRCARPGWPTGTPTGRARRAPPRRAGDCYFDELEPRFRAAKEAAERILALNQDAMAREERARPPRGGSHAAWRRCVARARGARARGRAPPPGSRGAWCAPLSVLSQAVEAFGRGDFAARALVRGRDEVAPARGRLQRDGGPHRGVPAQLPRRAGADAAGGAGRDGQPAGPGARLRAGRRGADREPHRRGRCSARGRASRSGSRRPIAALREAIETPCDPRAPGQGRLGAARLRGGGVRSRARAATAPSCRAASRCTSPAAASWRRRCCCRT